MVSTRDFQSLIRGSIPLGTTKKFRDSVEVTLRVLDPASKVRSLLPEPFFFLQGEAMCKMCLRTQYSLAEAEVNDLRHAAEQGVYGANDKLLDAEKRAQNLLKKLCTSG